MGSGLKRVRKSKKQQIWAFMRRNRQFRAGDMMMILDVTQDFLMPIFRALELCDYLHLETGSDNFRDRIYRLKRDTGARSPIILKKPCDIVRDLNTGEEFVLDGNHPVQIADKIRFMMALRSRVITREDIAKNAGIHQFSAKSIRYLNEFVELGIMQKMPRSLEAHNKRGYKVDMEVRGAWLRHFEASLREARSA